MKRSTYLCLWIAGLVMGVFLILIRPYTGYMDADYYFAGAKSLYLGRGFTDFTLWNYLSTPLLLPGPSHTYWMPLASIIAWLGMTLGRSDSLFAARLPFALLFSLTPVCVAALSWITFRSRLWAICSGLLVLLSGYFLKFVTQPDGFAVLFLSGAALIALLRMPRTASGFAWRSLALGGLAGLIHLTRADGLAWLGLLLIFLLVEGVRTRLRPIQHLTDLALLLAGYLIPTSPWYIRNYQEMGVIMTSGGIKAAYLTVYDQLFSYPADLLNLHTWLQSGAASVLAPRWQALKINLLSLWAVFTLIVLPPFVWMGVRRTWRKLVTPFLLLSALAFFGLMTFVFPLVGMRGGLLHSGAIFMPMIWLVVPPGMATFTDWVRSHRRFNQMSEAFVQFSLVGILTLVTGFVLWMDYSGDPALSQADTWQNYQAVDETITARFGDEPYTIMVNNPPAYYAAADRQAVAVPYGDTQTILRVARDFDVQYLALDQNYTDRFPELYRQTADIPAGFVFIDRIDGLTLFQLEVQP